MPKKRPNKPIGVVLHPADLPILKEWAEDEGYTISGLIRFIVHKAAMLRIGHVSPSAAQPTAISASPQAPKVIDCGETEKEALTADLKPENN